MILAEEKNIRKGEKKKKLTTANPSRSKQEVQILSIPISYRLQHIPSPWCQDPIVDPRITKIIILKKRCYGPISLNFKKVILESVS